MSRLQLISTGSFNLAMYLGNEDERLARSYLGWLRHVASRYVVGPPFRRALDATVPVLLQRDVIPATRHGSYLPRRRSSLSFWATQRQRVCSPIAHLRSAFEHRRLNDKSGPAMNDGNALGDLARRFSAAPPSDTSADG
jgi:hypothetical protein